MFCACCKDGKDLAILIYHCLIHAGLQICNVEHDCFVIVPLILSLISIIRLLLDLCSVNVIQCHKYCYALQESSAILSTSTLLDHASLYH